MSLLLSLFRPLYDSIFSTLLFRYCWQLFILQPLSLISASLTVTPWIFSRRYSVHWIPTRNGGLVGAIVFIPPTKEGDKCLRPPHLDMHGGAFIGGLAEYDARWCAKLSDEIGAVVVSSMYRYAPKHTFPAAIDDIDDVVGYLFKNAEVKFGANPELFAVGGSSAGGNLALAACQQPACQYPSKTAVRALTSDISRKRSRYHQDSPRKVPCGFSTRLSGFSTC